MVKVWRKLTKILLLKPHYKTFANAVKHVIEVNPNLGARITNSSSEPELDSYQLNYVDEIGSGYFEYRRVFGEWVDQYGKKYLVK